MTLDQWLTVGAGIVGALVGGLLSGIGSVRAVRAAQHDLEKDELRRLRLICFSNIMGLRHVLTNGVLASPEDRSKLSFEFNRAPALWSDYPDMINLLRDMREPGLSRNNGLLALLKKMGDTTALPVDRLADGDFMRSFNISG